MPAARVILALVLSVVAATGCTSAPQSPGLDAPRSPRVAFASPATVAWEQVTPTPDYLRFEYGRNDARAAQREAVAPAAATAWPDHPRPVERPIWFSRWEQN